MFLGRRNLYILSQDTYVKVGVAGSIEKRLRELQTGNPHTLFVYCIFYDMSTYEKICHRKLINDRVFTMLGSQDEWFYYTSETESLIKELVSIAEKNGNKYTIDHRFTPKKAK